ncbi:MAG: hypothetical protein DWQ07_16925 [Chloroflexi bacterium]|nr:MAG: hypothetical protein DWQ07_16925 [Chloroflexota bacterium]MBL1195088.1 hypothetical protein [Chloroflexota bacterium]NOH12375.1 hypothetical protein [Chloroflexota bacterium]
MPPIFSKKLGVGIFMPAFFLMSLLLLMTSTGCTLPEGTLTETDCTADAFLVTVELDIIDGVCDENCSLREAVLAANACPGPDVIMLESASNHQLAATGLGDERGDLNIHEDLTIDGGGRASTIIESSTFRVFSIDPGVDVTMQGLTIQGGQSTGDGGGILNAGNLTLENVALLDNSASGDGGGVSNSGMLTLTNVVVDGNRASRGGGILNTGVANLSGVQITSNQALLPFPASDRLAILPDTGRFHDCGGGINNQGSMTISSESVISYNYAGLGGGLCNGIGATMEINDSEISWNPNDGAGGLGDFRAVRAGGGIVNYSNLIIMDSMILGNGATYAGGIYGLMSEGGTIRLERSEVKDNIARRGHGGGVLMLGGNLEILQSLISENRASLDGGGLAIKSHFGQAITRMNVTITHSAIFNNRASRNGGGIEHRGGNSEVDNMLELVNVTLSGNTAVDGAGLHESSGGSGTTRLWHVTIADNTACFSCGSGAGIHYDTFAGTVIFKSTLVAGNHPSSECSMDLPSSVNAVSEGYNIDRSNLCRMIGGPRDFQRASDSVNFSVLTEVNGTFVHELFPSNPAVDWINDGGECAADDQRGQIRPAGVGCDVGAYELLLDASSADVPLIGTPTPDGPSTVTITTTTPCYNGPGPQYGQVSNLASGIATQLIGAGFTGNGNQDWVVTHHPTAANTPCWLDTDDVTPSIPFSEMRLITVPGLPTPTPKPTSDRPPQESTPACYYDANNALICP